ncbi:TetR/AcrR family transcriptional regulator [Rhodoplanes sp. TEM]|uniref:TetR/AcrR family transcriptional regulator n=1 Tax=Rhodoplanes tepidamans TaxID=200616 RepID=A0ABT5J8G4_RHOTP|nr:MULTISPECIES: TetR/AcrR family transcriptional regulator [Rhodoplanes]MDC7785924.1 TetR/AcrR family transcriptional regulator [Rhodoplanes tepidamans]MDC7987524.1 TetR/AcrR family transcriptional regulator [Rhodoplanes sp. TEM]MDQ0355457.1 TetR/AcrR family transcriptional regulator of autoinduction and epiphytic fitness [Rhodoplanes tepidamans]
MSEDPHGAATATRHPTDPALPPSPPGCPSPAAARPEVRRGRPPAGTDPAKRRQILEGAARIFSAMGFDAASMNDIAREAGVSKGTLYVYFEHKEELFCALISDQRHKHIEDLFSLIDDGPDIRATLTRFGIAYMTLLTSDWAVRVQRVVLGVTERMPEVGRGFFTEGPGCGISILADYFERMTRRGLLAVEDTLLASWQFSELCQAGLLRPRLYRRVDAPPSAAEIARVVGHAVEMFLRYYEPGPSAVPPPAV